jgi:putative IMPACT (imprinted ancient) family translation regulator
LENDLNVVTLEGRDDGTIVTWEEYFDAADVPMMQAHFQDALQDIANRLVDRFGGSVLETYPS